MNKLLWLSMLLIATESFGAGKEPKLVWPAPPDPARIEYVASINNAKDFGIEKGFFSKIVNFVFGDEDPVLNSPFGIDADSNRVYVTDIFAKALYIFDKDENEIQQIKGSEKESFLYPVDVVTDKKGNIYVSDSVRAKIYVFDEDGDFQYAIAPKALQRPVGIAISADGRWLYIVDAMASQIHVTTLKGNYLHSIGKQGRGKGEFNRPTFIDVGNDGKIYVSDSMNHRVQILDKNGKFVHAFGELSDNIGGFGSPRGIALDSDDNIYVNDTLYNTIQIFNSNGELLMLFGAYGSGKGEFALPIDISILADNTIYITDTNNKRFQMFKRLEAPKQ
ncbi:MAG: hypothetical protein DSZ03_07745 [Sulfurimonas sp.]|nr:MAG: hypothetical protein DSZ03_07745 [Sulfurimonas sp.]